MRNRSGRYLNVNVYVRNSGYHKSAWRTSPSDPLSALDLDHYIDLARTAERGVLDSIFLPDSPGSAEFRSEFLPSAAFDPLLLLAALTTATTYIGLIATVSTTYSYPWDVARRLATLDFLSRGRASWNVVTTRVHDRSTGRHPPHGQLGTPLDARTNTRPRPSLGEVNPTTALS
jgi:N-acetyl-S-(2-succino)cysteine monooxygenase